MNKRTRIILMKTNESKSNYDNYNDNYRNKNREETIKYDNRKNKIIMIIEILRIINIMIMILIKVKMI